MNTQHVIDGAQGEGGGQILRTTLTLAMCSGQSVRVENIRAGRPKPGLLRQHLAVVQAAAKVGGGIVVGAKLGSTRVTFEPGAITTGDFRFAIGSAGSTTLLWQTLLPALALADTASKLQLVGGTHNAWAPSLDFVLASFVPALARLGLNVSIALTRHGFYPQGGGEWCVRIEPWAKPKPLNLLERGELVQRLAIAKVADVPEQVARRELDRVQHKLGWHGDELRSAKVSAFGAGNMLSLQLQFANVTHVEDSLGELRVSAERVANRAIGAVTRYLEQQAPVGEYLADQLLVPMVLGAGGEFRCTQISGHTRTNIAVINQMLGAKVVRATKEQRGYLVQVQGQR